MHEVRLAKPHAAIEVKRIERRALRLADAALGDAARRRVTELVGLAHDEIVEGETRIERRADVGALDLDLGDSSAAILRRRRRRRKLRLGARLTAVCSYHHIHARDGAVLAVPEDADPLGIVRRHPIAQKFGRNRDAHAAAVDLGEGHRLEPAPIGGVADLVAQAATDARPLALNFWVQPLHLRHHFRSLGP